MQRHRCHCDLFSQIARLKKVMEKRTFIFVSMQRFHVTSKDNANQLEHDFFQNPVRIICIVADNINLQ